MLGFTLSFTSREHEPLFATAAQSMQYSMHGILCCTAIQHQPLRVYMKQLTALDYITTMDGVCDGHDAAAGVGQEALTQQEGTVLSATLDIRTDRCESTQ